jgi:GNAT superfamily N-acetyltransferase
MIKKYDKQLKMHRSAGLALPNIAPPAGFHMRGMREGEQTCWSQICLGEFDITEPSLDWFMKKMHDQPMSEIFFICNEADIPVGTATAQMLDGEPFLHYIAVHPEARGRGLAKPLMAAVLARHAALGRAGCYLTTDDPRLPAINSYLQFGWEPVMWSDDAQERWEKVMQQLEERT